MESLRVYNSSVICPLVKGETMTECCRIKRLCKEKVVDMCFFDDQVRVIGKGTRRMKVPSKALKDGQALISWMEQRIDKAWS